MTLFARKRQPDLEQPLPQPEAKIIPFPGCAVPERPVVEEKQRSYDELAASLGFQPTQLVRDQLLAFCADKGIKLYDARQVYAWMTKKRTEAGQHLWCWRAFREKDVCKAFKWGFVQANQSYLDGYYDSSKIFECGPYDLLVPQHALEKVALIEERFGDDVKFFVSDYTVKDVDPFIMVIPATICRHGSRWSYELVFDYWDEPGFGE